MLQVAIGGGDSRQPLDPPQCRHIPQPKPVGAPPARRPHRARQAGHGGRGEGVQGGGRAREVGGGGAEAAGGGCSCGREAASSTRGSDSPVQRLDLEVGDSVPCSFGAGGGADTARAHEFEGGGVTHATPIPQRHKRHHKLGGVAPVHDGRDEAGAGSRGGVVPGGGEADRPQRFPRVKVGPVQQGAQGLQGDATPCIAGERGRGRSGFRRARGRVHARRAPPVALHPHPLGHLLLGPKPFAAGGEVVHVPRAGRGAPRAHLCFDPPPGRPVAPLGQHVLLQASQQFLITGDGLGDDGGGGAAAAAAPRAAARSGSRAPPRVARAARRVGGRVVHGAGVGVGGDGGAGRVGEVGVVGVGRLWVGGWGERRDERRSCAANAAPSILCSPPLRGFVSPTHPAPDYDRGGSSHQQGVRPRSRARGGRGGGGQRACAMSARSPHIAAPSPATRTHANATRGADQPRLSSPHMPTHPPHSPRPRPAAGRRRPSRVQTARARKKRERPHAVSTHPLLRVPPLARPGSRGAGEKGGRRGGERVRREKRVRRFSASLFVSFGFSSHTLRPANIKTRALNNRMQRRTPSCGSGEGLGFVGTRSNGVVCWDPGPQPPPLPPKKKLKASTILVWNGVCRQSVLPRMGQATRE